MRNKKLVSTVVATALVASTMTMPIMAADGGEITVPVSTKTAVLKVTVPTTIAIAVDQFEMSDVGSQIYSGDFTMENNSAIGVKVGITSTASLKNTTKLVSTKAAATSDTAKSGEVWMAVASQTADGSYADDSTALKDLTEANKNVTTFAQEGNEGKAEQTYYFAKASAVAYKLLNASESAADIQYAQFYKLTAQTVANANDLANLLKTSDIYVGATTAADGQALTLVAKGGTHTYAAGEVYYTAEQEATAKSSITDSHTELFVYADGTADATDGKGAFRYIGKLSGAQETWAKEDIPSVKIKYDIVGVDQTGYDKVKDNCAYGLYTNPASSVPATVAVPASGDVTVVVTKGSNNDELTKLETTLFAGDMLTKSGGYGATYQNGKITLGADVAAYLRAASADDLASATFTATFGTGENAYTQQFKFTK